MLIYHLVTGGAYPFEAQTPLELYARVVNNPPTYPTRHNPDLSSEYENLILILLSKQPYQRVFTHEELRTAIESTPMSIRVRTRVAARRAARPYPKKCFFRLLHTEKSVVESFIQAGGAMDGFIYPANYLPRYRRCLETFQQLGLEYLFDPVAYRLTYSSFGQTQGVVNLPYVMDRDNILTRESLQTLQAQQTYARACIDWQLRWNCSILVAPFHFCRDLTSPWIEVDIKLIEESVAYVRTIQDSPPVYAGLCLNIEAYTSQQNRMALVNRYSRARTEGYLFYVDNIDERTDNRIQIRAMLELLRLFQQLGKPVFACRVGTLGLGLLAAGVDVMTTGIASLTGFSESGLLASRATGYDMSPKYYIPSMLLTVPVPLAEDILSDANNADLRCNCPHCGGRYRNLARVAKVHFLETRTQETRHLNSLRSRTERLQWFLGRVNDAISACRQVSRQGTVALPSSRYSHLSTWRGLLTDCLRRQVAQ